MRKIKILPFVCLLVLMNLKGAAQPNLVPNGDLEQYLTCPSNASLPQGKQSSPQYWYKPDKRGGGYWNACSPTLNVPFAATAVGPGYQPARSGVGYIGMYYRSGNDVRNYFQVKLNDSLRAGKCYYGEYYVSLANGCNLGCNNQSMLLTAAPIYADTAKYKLIIPASPQIMNAGNIITDTVNWVKVSGVFTAVGGEQYLTLGNFKTDAETNYLVYYPGGSHFGALYFADDVAVYALDSFPLPADAGRDTSILLGDSLYIGSYTTGLTNTVWYSSSGSVMATGVPGFYIKPVVSSFYVLEQSVCGQYSRDTVFVNVGVLPLKFLSYNLTLTASQRVINRWVTATEINVSHHNIQRSSDGVNFYSVGRQPAKNSSYNEYEYVDENPLRGKSFYRIESEDKDGSKTYSKTLKVEVSGSREILSVYPNPARTSVTVLFKAIKEIRIMDLFGRTVAQTVYNGIDNVVNLSTGRLVSGLYLIKVPLLPAIPKPKN